MTDAERKLIIKVGDEVIAECTPCEVTMAPKPYTGADLIQDFMHFYLGLKETEKTRKMVNDLIKQFEKQQTQNLNTKQNETT